MPGPQTIGWRKNNNMENMSQTQVLSSTGNRAELPRSTTKKAKKEIYKEIIQSCCTQKLQRETEHRWQYNTDLFLL